MRLTFLSRDSCAIPASDARLARFREVLLAARRTVWYPPVLKAASLDTPEQIAAVCSIEAGVVRLAPLRLSTFLVHREVFRASDTPKRRPPLLFFPFTKPPRTAVLEAGFDGRARVRAFPDGWTRQAARFQPEAIAGPVDALRKLALAVRAGDTAMTSLACAVIAFTGPGRSVLEEADRESFWQAFRVPVFEQMLGFENELLAWECEGHQGLHVNPECAFFECEETAGGPKLLLTCLGNFREPVLRLRTGLVGRVEKVVCSCGDAADRLSRSQPSRAPLAAAASAKML